MSKKAAVILYPCFSMQEISCLTEALTVYFGRELDVYASSAQPVRSENGFLVVPDRTLDAFCISDYDCVILPGAANPLYALFDEALIAFLRTLRGESILIAAICSAPMLLAKARLLDGVRYTASVWEEINEYLTFIPRRNIVRKPLVRDGNIITAVGAAFREFAVETVRALGIDGCPDGLFLPPARDMAEEELIFHMRDEDFEEFKLEYQAFAEAKTTKE